MKHYVYKISNIIEDKHYIGARSAKNPKKDLGIQYFSSSSDKEFMSEQREFPERFEYKILEVFSTRKLAIAKEIELHDLYDVAVNESFYNRSKQTNTGFCTLGTSHSHSQETREKMSASLIGENNPMWGKSPSKEAREKMSASLTGEKHFMWGKSPSKEAREKMRLAKLDKPKSEEHRIKISDSLKGRVFSEVTRENMRVGQQKRYIENARRFIIHDAEGNLIHDEVVINFREFCLRNNYTLGSFSNSYRTNEPIKGGKFKGWTVRRTNK